MDLNVWEERCLSYDQSVYICGWKQLHGDRYRRSRIGTSTDSHVRTFDWSVPVGATDNQYAGYGQFLCRPLIYHLVNLFPTPTRAIPVTHPFIQGKLFNPNKKSVCVCMYIYYTPHKTQKKTQIWANIGRYYTGQQLIAQLCQRAVKRQLNAAE